MARTTRLYQYIRKQSLVYVSLCVLGCAYLVVGCTTIDRETECVAACKNCQAEEITLTCKGTNQDKEVRTP